MIRFTKWPLWVAVLAGAFMLGTANPARADMQLQLIEGTSTTTASSTSNAGPVLYNGNVGSDFTVTIAYGDSNSPGGLSALAEESTTKITNNSSNDATITIQVSAQGFNSPESPPPLTVLDTVSGSVLTGGLVSGTAQGFADSTNALFGTGFASTLLKFGPNGPSTSFAQNGAVGGFSPDGKTYSLTFTETFTLAGHTTITLSGGNVQAVVPEPTSMLAAISAMPFLALGAWLRRRRQVAIA